MYKHINVYEKKMKLINSNFIGYIVLFFKV